MITKPIGAYADNVEPPAWASFGMLNPFGTLPTWRRPGFKWVIQLGFGHPLDSARDEALRARERLTAAGLWPDVVAAMWGEEWFARFDAGEFAPFGLPASSPDGVPIIGDYLARKHAEILAAVELPIVYLAPEVRADRPVPAGVAFVAIDRYPVDGEDAAALGAALVANEAHTALPLVIVMRWWKATGDTQGPAWRVMSADPVREWAEVYALLLARPRWVAAVGFLWPSRPWANLVGLADMPAARAAVESVLVGV